MVRVWLSILLVAAGSYTVFAIYRQAKHEVETSERVPTQIDLMPDGIKPATLEELGDVKLLERSGRPFALRELEGQVWVGSFFFASCPGPCRQINIALSGLQKEWADKPVKFVSITVDPDNDTPEALTRYAASFDAEPERWLFVTGDFPAIKELCQRFFQMPVDKKVHTERLTLVDRAGRPRGNFNTGNEAQMRALRQQLDELLAEPAPAASAAKATPAAVVKEPVEKTEEEARP
jgi:cytochrome oxidase Cu insertion factor (SCO1/SenC/PrrC family)